MRSVYLNMEKALEDYNMDNSLYEKLLELGKTDEYAFHMPGHKRNETEKPFDEIMKLDITEIEGFDNLHHPEGIIKQEQEFAAQLYGAKATYFLVNGSTCGILAAICAMTSDRDSIIFSRNSHKSGYHALYLKGLNPIYVYPEQKQEAGNIYGTIHPEDIASQMDMSGAKVVFITSPTYEGVVCDIEKISEIVHEKGGILIVDEAHGAHLGFHPYFPESAVKKGADIVIQSMHKTLPSLTQTALLHICSDRVCRQKVEMQLSIFQTSSPSYVLMASMSRCLHFIEKEGASAFDVFAYQLSSFYEKTRQLHNLYIMDKNFVKKTFGAQFDPSKINIYTQGFTDRDGKRYGGKELAKELLEKYHLQIEMVSEDYVIAMTSLYDSQDGFRRLTEALFEIDGRLISKEPIKGEKEKSKEKCHFGQTVITIKEAVNAPKSIKKWEDCVGAISAEFMFLYPPGSPIVTPGERITKEIWETIDKYKSLGLSIQGTEDYTMETIFILDEKTYNQGILQQKL